jgi:methylmalonyl-CoA mutase cobalamin-binding subunit
MRHLKQVLAAATAATLGLATTGCDSPAQQEVDAQAEAIDEAYEADADLVEAYAEGGPNEEAAEKAADALRKEGEETKDHLKDMSDELGDTPQ